jgi:16S rRNA (guanine527-N7)-methyltransferase
VLLDKNSKKTRFLTQVVAELGLENVTVMHARCEDFRPAHGFTSILSRAFGSIRLFVETTQHLLAPGGRWLAMKGQYPEQELAELPPRFVVQSSERAAIKGRDIERHIIVVTN